MKAAIHSEHPARPIPSLFIGVLLLLFSSSILLQRLFASELAIGFEIQTEPTSASLLLTMLGGIYLLACVHREAHLRKLHQRLAGSAMLIASATLLYHLLRGTPPPLAFELPAIDALIAFLIAGLAALLNPSVRTLSQLAGIFLLILFIATLAIIGVTNYVLDYEPFFTWRMARHMSPLIATGLLMFAFGLSYTSWWCHRLQVFDPISGITLIASILLIYSALLGAGLIYAVAVSYLHVEIRSDLTTLITERSARIVSLLRHGQEFSQLLSEEARHSPAHAVGHQLAADYALRITRSDGSVAAARNGDWFERKTISAITNHQTTLWRGEEGHCQLRTAQQVNGRLIGRILRKN